MKSLLTFIYLCFLTFLSFSKSPDGFSYQAIIRDAVGNLKKNQSVSIDFEILDASDVAVYSESHTTTTDDYGLVNLVIGQGTTSDDFSAIDWGNGTYSVNVSIDGTDMGTSQLWSVPYAISASNGISTLQADAITANTAKVAGASNVTGLSDALIETNSIYIGNDPSSTTDDAKYNVAVGKTALDAITTGDGNTANGYDALTTNTEGGYNTASGAWALQENISGHSNTASGTYALLKNETGNQNTATGSSALYTNTEGDYNTASGYGALQENIEGNSNTALGSYAGDKITTGSSNVIIGYNADANANNASNQIVIGYNATGTGDNQIALGNTSITAIKGQVAFSTYSDKRIKREISDGELGLDFINKLRPVKYKLKNPADYPAELLEERFSSLPGSGPYNENVVRPEDDETIYDGLIAQEVKTTMDELNVDWSGWSKNESDGKEGIQYGALTIPLIKAIQEQQEMIQKQQEMIEELRERLDHVEGSID